MLKMKLPGKMESGRPNRRFMDVWKADVWAEGVEEEDSGDKEMGTDDPLWLLLAGTAERRREL